MSSIDNGKITNTQFLYSSKKMGLVESSHRMKESSTLEETKDSKRVRLTITVKGPAGIRVGDSPHFGVKIDTKCIHSQTGVARTGQELRGMAGGGETSKLAQLKV